MRIFITGGSGYLGAHLVQTLTKDHAITAITRSATRARELQRLGAETATLALQDALEKALCDHEVLIHNALVWDETPTELELEDTRLAIKLFEAAARAGVRRVLLTSSLAVHRPFVEAMCERDALHSADSYGAIKASNELFFSALARQHNMELHVVRVGPVVGPPAYEGAAFKSDPRFVKLIKQAALGEDIVVQHGEGRQFVGAADVARTYSALLTTDRVRETWICTAENFTTWEHIAARIIERMRSSSRLIVEGEAAPHSFETTKLARLLDLRFNSDEAMHAHIAHLARLHTI